MKSSFLYRVVVSVEFVSSIVIAIFGVNTFVIYHQMGHGFQAEKEMIEYSSIVAVVQSILTLFASFFLIGCHYSSIQQEQRFVQEAQNSGDQKRVSQIGQQYSLRRKAIAPTWIAWTLISIASLLFVFLSPLHYCIQAESDRKKLTEFAQYESVDTTRLGQCYSEDPHLAPIRNSLKDLYSFSIVGIILKSLFILLVHRNWRKEMRNMKKVVIYVEDPESNNGSEISTSVIPKVTIETSGPTGSSFVEGSE